MAGRRVVIVRHGERVDFTFSDEWIKTSFSDKNTYLKQNLNMPDSIPNRKGSPQSFFRDCPLTQIGNHQGFLTGKGLLENNVLRDGFEVYVSPALRCVQTATALGKGMEKDLMLKIEPCLFEWTEWFTSFMPTMMTIEEYKENNYNVDTSYIPRMTISEIKDNSLDDYYERSFQLINHLLESTDKDLLIVAHAASLDTLTRQLSGESIPSSKDFIHNLKKISYCGVAVAESKDDVIKNGNWSLISLPRLSMRHATVADFDAFKTFSQDSPSESSENQMNIHS